MHTQILLLLLTLTLTCAIKKESREPYLGAVYLLADLLDLSRGLETLSALLHRLHDNCRPASVSVTADLLLQ